jgi:hypothetical membrane protein
MASGTYTLPRHRERAATPATTRTRISAAVLAGVLLAGAGMSILMGIITAESLYDAVYTTHGNEISDLGATRPPDSVSYQPSSAIFNTLMIVTGLMIAAGALSLHRAYGVKHATVPLLLLGIGVLGVGIFPGNRGAVHPWFALMAFVFGGVAAITVAGILAAPFKYLSISAGATTLASLVVGMLGDATPLWDHLGDGGVERWIAYPVVLWHVAFGGYLMAPRDTTEARDEAPP